MIAVLTYNAPHRKTQDLCFRLKLRGYNEVTIFATPWEDRQSFKPLFKHRPDALNHGPEELSRAFNYDFEEIDSINEIEGESVILIGGAGVLPKRDNIINSHPAFLPYGPRGLDALKWAIYEGTPIGVTTYFIGEECDTGILIDQRYTPINPQDDFYTLAMRHYELEVDMLADSVEKHAQRKYLFPDLSVAHRRMPHDIELAMMRKWNSR